MMGEWDKTKILIVGGAGFVGSNLAQRLLEKRVGNIIIVDNLLSSEPENIPQDDRIVFFGRLDRP